VGREEEGSEKARIKKEEGQKGMVRATEREGGIEGKGVEGKVNPLPEQKFWLLLKRCVLGVLFAEVTMQSQWLNCPATGGGSLSLKLLDYTFVRLREKFRSSIKHSIPPCTRKVCFCSQLKYTEP